MGEFDEYLNRRMLTEQGWVYFCRICGEYKPQQEFYNRKDTKFGIETRCKIHFTKKGKDDEGGDNHLKLAPLRKDDFLGAQKLLEGLGYKFGVNELTVYQQFLSKHNING
jgi:hypothetical protein